MIPFFSRKEGRDRARGFLSWLGLRDERRASNRWVGGKGMGARTLSLCAAQLGARLVERVADAPIVAVIYPRRRRSYAVSHIHQYDYERREACDTQSSPCIFGSAQQGTRERKLVVGEIA